MRFEICLEIQELRYKIQDTRLEIHILYLETQHSRYALRYVSCISRYKIQDTPWDTRFKIQDLRYALRYKIQDTTFKICLEIRISRYEIPDPEHYLAQHYPTQILVQLWHLCEICGKLILLYLTSSGTTSGTMSHFALLGKW